jgi:hypothetical protein
MERLRSGGEHGPGDLADKLVIQAVRAYEIQVDVEIGLRRSKGSFRFMEEDQGF